MARNGSGVYSKVNTFVAGATVTASGHNQNWDDLVTEMTNSVAADGQTSMTGPLKASAGTVAAPSYTFSADTDTGFYRVTTNSAGVAAGGANVATFASTGVAILGTTTNDSAAAGYVGEFFSTTRLISSPTTLTTATKADIATLALTAGDWDVYGTVGLTMISSNPTVTSFAGWIHNVSATEPTDPNEGAKGIVYTPAGASGDNQFAEIPGLRKRVLIATPTTLYLTILASFTGGSLGGYGFIGARRFR